MKKKVFSAVALAAITASFASAEVKITMNGRLRPNFFANDNTRTEKQAGDSEANSRDVMSLDGLASFEDTLKLAFTNEAKSAGLTFSVNVKNGNDSSSSSSSLSEKLYKHENGTINTNKNKETGETKAPTEIKSSVSNTNSKLGNFLTLNQFDIWANVFDTGLKIGAGSWKDGFADGAYRVKKDVDYTNAEGLNFERFKLGSMFAKAPSVFVDDIANFAGGSNALAAYAEYPVKIDDQMSLNLTAVAVKADYDDDEGDKTTNYKSGWVGRVQFGMKDTVNVEFITKQPVHNQHIFALYAMPLMVENLALNVGGSYTYASGSAKGWNGAWNVDLRARYQVLPELSITTFNNISGLKAGDDKVGTKGENAAGAMLGSGIVGVSGSQKLGTDVTVAMWNNISAVYKVNDILDASLNIGLINALSTEHADNKDGNDYGINIRVTPGVQVTFVKGATLWAGVSYSHGSVENKDTKVKTIYNSWSIPAIFRVKM